MTVHREREVKYLKRVARNGKLDDVEIRTQTPLMVESKWWEEWSSLRRARGFRRMRNHVSSRCALQHWLRSRSAGVTVT
jgi:hypothetical protein